MWDLMPIPGSISMVADGAVGGLQRHFLIALRHGHDAQR